MGKCTNPAQGGQGLVPAEPQGEGHQARGRLARPARGLVFQLADVGLSVGPQPGSPRRTLPCIATHRRRE